MAARETSSLDNSASGGGAGNSSTTLPALGLDILVLLGGRGNGECGKVGMRHPVDAEPPRCFFFRCRLGGSVPGGVGIRSGLSEQRWRDGGALDVTTPPALLRPPPELEEPPLAKPLWNWRRRVARDASGSSNGSPAKSRRGPRLLGCDGDEAGAGESLAKKSLASWTMPNGDAPGPFDWLIGLDGGRCGRAPEDELDGSPRLLQLLLR